MEAEATGAVTMAAAEATAVWPVKEPSAVLRVAARAEVETAVAARAVVAKAVEATGVVEMEVVARAEETVANMVL